VTTKIVTKGTNRPAHTARTNRHAQRTPLPPKPGQVEDAQEVIASTPKRASQRQNFEDAIILEKVVPQYGKMTQAQLLKAAQDLGLEPPKSAPKGKLLNAILAKEKSDRADAKVDQALAGDPKADAIDAAFEVPSSKPQPQTGVTKSRAKANDFIGVAASLGWAADATSDGDHTQLTIRRGGESIDLAWDHGVFQHPCTYSFNGRTVLLRNASAAKARMAIAAEAAEEETARVAVRKTQRAEKAATPKKARTKALPFSELSTDQEVLDAVEGKTIKWVSSLTGAEDTDRVPAAKEIRRKANQPKIQEAESGRVLTFPGSSGFRSVRVSSIIAVR
jgi:hypothetical protein